VQHAGRRSTPRGRMTVPEQSEANVTRRTRIVFVILGSRVFLNERKGMPSYIHGEGHVNKK
jgi:hypothetical protein